MGEKWYNQLLRLGIVLMTKKRKTNIMSTDAEWIPNEEIQARIEAASTVTGRVRVEKVIMSEQETPRTLFSIKRSDGSVLFSVTSE